MRRENVPIEDNKKRYSLIRPQCCTSIYAILVIGRLSRIMLEVKRIMLEVKRIMLEVKRIMLEVLVMMLHRIRHSLLVEELLPLTNNCMIELMS
jgi:hypothetical protein